MSGGKKIYSWLQRWLDEDYHSKVIGNSKTARIMQTTNSESGMPYFMLGKFITSGFDPSWGWNEVKEYYFDIGLEKSN